jgi:hypothetical protein
MEDTHMREGRTKERAVLLRRFDRCDYDVLFNYGVLTEGFDDPSIECLLLARPTTSPLVYNQCLGRGSTSRGSGISAGTSSGPPMKIDYAEPKSASKQRINPRALLRSMLPEDVRISRFDYDPDRGRIEAEVSGLEQEMLEQIRRSFEGGLGHDALAAGAALVRLPLIVAVARLSPS